MLNDGIIYKQIQDLTSDLIKIGICNDQNFPSITRLSRNITEIGIGKINISVFLKNVAYKDMWMTYGEFRDLEIGHGEFEYNDINQLLVVYGNGKKMSLDLELYAWEDIENQKLKYNFDTKRIIIVGYTGNDSFHNILGKSTGEYKDSSIIYIH